MTRVAHLLTALFLTSVAACTMAPINESAPEQTGDTALAAKGGKACASSDQCSADKHCSTEDGVCNPPPGCKPGQVCIALCYGTCVADAPATVTCGTATCAAGEYCCNESCGICAPEGGFCTMQVCESQPL